MTRIAQLFSAAAMLLVCGACATVNPKPDYLMASQHVEAATGVDVLSNAQDDGIAQVVEDLVSGGLTANEAVKVCLLNNPNLQAALLDIGMARADLVQAGLFSNPFLGIAAKLPDGGGLANLEAGISQNISDLWQIPLRKRAAKRELHQTILRIAREAATLAAESKAAYYDAVGEGQRLAIANENLEIASELLAMAIARQQAGAATQLDVNLSRSLTIDAELAVESTRLADADARRRLATLLGLETNAEQLRLTDPLPDPPATAPEVETLVDAAKAWRLDIRSARQAVAAAAWRLKEQRRLLIPTVEVGIEFERGERGPSSDRNILADTARASIANGGSTAPEIEPRSARRKAKGQDIIVGPSLGIELPLFDQHQAQIAKATFAHEQAIKTLCALERATTQEVRGAVDRAATAWRVAAMYRDRSVPLAQSNLDLAREAYQAGRTSFLSVLEAQRFFLDSRRGYIDASRAAAVSIPELERVVGLPFAKLFADIPEPPVDDPDALDTEPTP